MAKQTKLIPNRIYKKVIGERTHYATCVNVLTDRSGVYGTLSAYMMADVRLREGSDECNAWQRVRSVKREPIDIAELIEDIGDVIGAVTGTVVDVATKVDGAVEAIGDLKKPSRKAKE